MQIPPGLDLDAWINDPPSDNSDSEDPDMNEIFVKADKSDNFSRQDSYELSNEELQKRREARKLEQENNPHYLKVSSNKNSSYHNSNNNGENFDNIPVAELDIPVSLKITDFRNSKKYLNIDEFNKKKHRKLDKKKRSKKNKGIGFKVIVKVYLFIFRSILNTDFLNILGRKSSSSEDEQNENYPSQLVNTGIGELPPGAELSGSDDDDDVDANDPHRALNIDLDLPLREDEGFPVRQHRHVEGGRQDETESINKKEKVNY